MVGRVGLDDFAKRSRASAAPSICERGLVYLDPPYYVKGEGLYENHYQHVQKVIKQPWVVSYDHAPVIKKLYAKCPSITYGINYSAQDRYKGAELMFFSKRLTIPDVKNPCKVG
jgi:DNA adenine methylase